MSEWTRKEFLFVSHRWPGRLDVQDTANVLGFAVADIPVLVRAGLLTPLGKPVAQNAVKWFAAVDVEQACRSVEWLHKATRAVSKYHRERNQKAQNVALEKFS